MKVIDLLNKIANGEEVPERIKVDNIIYRYEDWERFYYTDNESREDLLVKGKDYSTNDFLNWDVELIEENQDIDIQGIEELGCPSSYWGTDNVIENRKKIDELIQAIKQLDRQINNK